MSRQHAESVPDSTLEILRCQQTLEALVPEKGGLRSSATGVLYPVRHGIVYMGYDERDHDFVQNIIEAERIHQATPSAIEPSLAFLRTSSLAVIDLIRLIRPRARQRAGLRGLELGAGSGWASWLFAEAGYEMWICELELNSLFLGNIYQHARLGAGRRIACDATLVPFADRSFDFVLCKEFSHHVSEKERLFREANRVLKPGGLLLTMDPVRSITSIVDGWRRPDPIPEHAISWTHQYLRAVRRSGFKVLEYGAQTLRRAKRVPFTAWAVQRTNEAMQRGALARDPLTLLYLHVVGGALIVLAAKDQEAPRIERPRIHVIDPAQLRVSVEDQADFRRFRELLEERAKTYLAGPSSAARPETSAKR